MDYLRYQYICPVYQITHTNEIWYKTLMNMLFNFVHMPDHIRDMSFHLMNRYFYSNFTVYGECEMKSTYDSFDSNRLE